ncbi:gephyrin-like molybdotransferase receptor GlpR [Streptomyces sp. NPDC056486]|uniref:divisome protein SepX/GlpR n=1 Tax=Streptomyces sp. NPDC056486 TaxID=3345835 RepID=UPI0036BC4D0A
MSSSGLIYAVIVGAWAAYLVPMWLRRQDELNEARPTERFSTAIRLLSGRAGMERRYAKDLQARSPEEEESRAPDNATGSVDVRAFVAPPHRQDRQGGQEERPEPQGKAPVKHQAQQPSVRPPAQQSPSRSQAQQPPQRPQTPQPSQRSQAQPAAKSPAKRSVRAQVNTPAPTPAPTGARPQQSPAQRAASAEAAARARRSKVLARRRRTTVMLFVAFTLGAVVAAVGGLAFLWAPAAPAALLSAYIVYLRGQERRRFTYTMDRRRAEVAAQRLRERQPRRRASGGAEAVVDDAEEGPAPETETGLSALAADRRALVEQTDHAEWVDQQRERQRRPGHGDSWDPVPVPLPTYVTAPVAPRATGDVDLSAPDAWSSARSSSVGPAADEAGGEADGSEYAGATEASEATEYTGDGEGAEGADGVDGVDGRSDARRAASARRARERGRTPLFDQYDDGERPRAANE